MKKLLTFSVLALLVGVLGFTSCKKDNGGTTGLPAPTGLNETNVTDVSATLNWTAVQGAAGYEVIFDGVAKPVTTNVILAVSSLTASTEYTWSVAAVDAAGGKSTSAPRKFTTATAIAPPSNLAVTAGSITATGAIFTWTASTDATVTGYEIRFNGGTERAVTGTTYTATDLSAATDYTWDVRAVAPAGKSAYVAGQAFKTASEPLLPPSNLQVVDDLFSAVVLSWDPVSNSQVDGLWLQIVKASEEYANNGYPLQPISTFATGVSGIPLEPATTYKWRIASVIGMVISGNSVTLPEVSAYADGANFTTSADSPTLSDPFTISDLLGAYSAVGTPWVIDADENENLIFLPGNGVGSWSSDITASEDNTWININKYAANAMDLPIAVDIVGDKLKLDNYYPVWQGNVAENTPGYISTNVTYEDLSLNGQSIWLPRSAVEVVWDADAKTLKFAQYEGKNVAVGLVAFQNSGSLAGFLTDFYTDVTITLGTDGQVAGFSGRPIDMNQFAKIAHSKLISKSLNNYQYAGFAEKSLVPRITRANSVEM